PRRTCTRFPYTTLFRSHLRALADRLDHQNLNELEPFTTVEPSAENQAKYFYDEMKRLLPEPMREGLLYVKVWETPTQFAQYSERSEEHTSELQSRENLV